MSCVSGRACIWSSHCSRSSSEEGISFPLGQKARGELMRGASSACKIDHESRSIQIKVNTAPLACSIASLLSRLREGLEDFFPISQLHPETNDTEMRAPMFLSL